MRHFVHSEREQAEKPWIVISVWLDARLGAPKKNARFEVHQKKKMPDSRI